MKLWTLPDLARYVRGFSYRLPYCKMLLISISQQIKLKLMID